MADVDVSVVIYRPGFVQLEQLLASLAEQTSGLVVDLLLLDNSPEPEYAASIEALPLLRPGAAFARVKLTRSRTNVGFGAGHNANAEHGHAPFLLVINQDCALEPDVLKRLLDTARADDVRVAAWELRQIPYEHPKAYDPVTLDTPWVSGAAALFRRTAFDAIGGFDSRIFMYGEDVDLSWRLRAKGFRLRYLPQLAVVHRTYKYASEVKPLQVFGGVEASLCLRARFGGFRQTLKGLVMLGAEVLAPQQFPGRRTGLVKAFFRFLSKWPYFAATRVRPTADFAPHFAGWSYELRRDGAFVPFQSRRDATTRETPLVSILIRTVDRGAWLEQALTSVANQTWPNVEAIVIEDGAPRAQAIVDRFRDRLPIRYLATGERVGRARAGNLALAEASGEWLNFLDDDDVLFADHVEVLMDAVQERSAYGAYALSWETPTRILDRERAHYEELEYVTRHRQRFDRLILWHHNYLPIQAVLFHRSLYDRHGGFAEDMDQLEDWNLWTRYTLNDPFVLVEKTTSKYRVPASAKDAADRQQLLDRAYHDAVDRQRALMLTLSPREITEMAEACIRSRSLVVASMPAVRDYVRARPWLARLAAWRGPLMRRLRGRRTT